MIPKNTIIEPTPNIIITCPSGNVWLAILISKSHKVKQPIPIIIRIMLFRFALIISSQTCHSANDGISLKPAQLTMTKPSVKRF
jgi:hypothetical protein